VKVHAAGGAAPRCRRPHSVRAQRGCDTLLVRGPDAADPEPESGQILGGRESRWPSTLGREEQEAGAFLIGVAKWTTMWV
jgi:hypothetical protein